MLLHHVFDFGNTYGRSLCEFSLVFVIVQEMSKILPGRFVTFPADYVWSAVTLSRDGVARIVDGSTDITVARSAAFRVIMRSEIPVSILKQIMTLKVTDLILTQEWYV